MKEQYPLPSNSNTLWDSQACPTFSSQITSQELLSILAFSFLPKLSCKKFLDLYRHYGSAFDAWQNCSSQLQGDQLKQLAENELAKAQKHGIDIVPIISQDFPLGLRNLSAPPLMLYIKGKLPPPNSLNIAIIGTRNATEWGKECGQKFAQVLSSLDAWIVSGLARGIDSAAHTGARDRTVAFIGSGLLDIYPHENRGLAEKIAASGAVVSELHLTTPPSRFSFPKRNRLIAAFSQALLLIEAPIKSGAMITMQLGSELNKELFALPGRALSEGYGGNHKLIKEAKARLVETPQELAKLLNLPLKNSINSTSNLQKIDADEKKILDLLCQSALCLEELSQLTGLPISHLHVLLMKLVLKNLAVELPGKRYKTLN